MKKEGLDTAILENYLARYINRVAISNSKIEYVKSQSKVKLIYNDYAKQEEGKAAPKADRFIDPLVFIDQFIQHVLPPYFQKSRRYGIHSSATKRRLKGLLPAAIKRNGHIIRTVFQILTQLLLDTPYQCEKCQSKEYSIAIEPSDKNWIKQYLTIPGFRSPPINPPHINYYNL